MLGTLLERLLVPPLCPACRGRTDEGQPVCRACLSRLDGEAPVAGIRPSGAVEVVSAHRHESVARDLLNAYKFRSGASLAPFLATRIIERCGPASLAGVLVPVPPSRAGLAQRGFDSAALIARALADLCEEAEVVHGLVGRPGRGRQLGRDRRSRLAVTGGVVTLDGLEGPAILIDDVVTTGATIAASARALRSAGVTVARAVTFSRRP